MSFWIKGKTKFDENAFVGFNATYRFYFWTREKFRAKMFDSEVEAFNMLKTHSLSGKTCDLLPIKKIKIEEWGSADV